MLFWEIIPVKGRFPAPDHAGMVRVFEARKEPFLFLIPSWNFVSCVFKVLSIPHSPIPNRQPSIRPPLFPSNAFLSCSFGLLRAIHGESFLPISAFSNPQYGYFILHILPINYAMFVCSIVLQLVLYSYKDAD